MIEVDDDTGTTCYLSTIPRATALRAGGVAGTASRPGVCQTRDGRDRAVADLAFAGTGHVFHYLDPGSGRCVRRTRDRPRRTSPGDRTGEAGGTLLRSLF